MEINPAAQGAALIGSLLMGAALGVVYDALRLARHRIKGRAVTVGLDLLFWAVCLAAFLWYTLPAAGGEVRWDLLCGGAAGGLVYFLTLSRLARALLRLLADFVLKLFALCALPFRWANKQRKKFQKNFKNYFISRQKWYRIDNGMVEMEYMSVRANRQLPKKGGVGGEAQESIAGDKASDSGSVLLHDNQSAQSAKRHRRIPKRARRAVESSDGAHHQQ